MLSLKVTVPPDIIIDGRTAAEAARMAVSETVREHLRRKNSSTTPNRNGLPKSNYWADAADSVTNIVRTIGSNKGGRPMTDAQSERSAVSNVTTTVTAGK